MSSNAGFDFLRFRDGTSQQQRLTPALDPDYFAVDERSIRDLLLFARRYTRTLLFYNKENKATGDWSAFLDGDLDEMVAYLMDPAHFATQPDRRARFEQPHLSLFLAFIALLQQSQLQMNHLTRRQLDFYFEQALGLIRRQGRPDHVHVLARLELGTDELLLPKGQVLLAGEDDDGEIRHYQTEEELLVNRAQIVQLKSAYVDQKIQTLALIREEKKDDDPKEALRDMLRVVYRLPGTEHTPRPYPDGKETDRDLDLSLLRNLDYLADYIEHKLHLRVTAFQYIMELYDAWRNPINWHHPGKDQRSRLLAGVEERMQGGGINDYMARAKAALNDGAVVEAINDSLDFDQNFHNFFGFSPVPQAGENNSFFVDLEGIDHIYDLFEAYNHLDEDDEKKSAIEAKLNSLGFGLSGELNPPISDFLAMMRVRMDTLKYLQEIIRLLDNGQKQARGEAIGDEDVLPPQRTPKPNLYLEYHADNTLTNIIHEVTGIDAVDNEHFEIKENNVTKTGILGADKEQLSISFPDENTLINNVFLGLWKSVPNKGGFSIHKTGADGTLTFPVDSPQPLVQVNAFSMQIPLEGPDSFLQVNFSGASQPTVAILLAENIRNPVEISVEDNTKLIIRLQAEQKDQQSVLALPVNQSALLRQIADWNAKEEEDKHGFSLQALGPPANIRPLDGALHLHRVRKFVLELNLRPDGGKLIVTYTGLAPAPQLAFSTSAPTEVTFAVTDHRFTDAYFQIKAQQLSQIESYFRMRAEDYFFISGMFVEPEDRDGSIAGSKNWSYKEPVWQWEKVDQLLEKSYQEITRTELQPEIVYWKNIYVASEAEQVIVPPFDEQETYPRWKTFGKKPLAEAPTDTQIVREGELGFVFASSALRLTEGKRMLVLSLTFAELGFDVDRLQVLDQLETNPPEARLYPFRIYLSTEAKWVEIVDWTRFAFDPGERTIEIGLEVTEDMDALAPVADDPYPSPWPALKMVIRSKKENENGLDAKRSNYELLKNLQLLSVSLDISVSGLRNLHIQTPLGRVDPNSPFEPFGIRPALRDRFFLTHPDLATQRLDSLELLLDWKNLPNQGLAAYYEPYTLLGAALEAQVGTNLGIPDTITAADFQVRVSLRDQHRELVLPANAAADNPPAPGSTETHELFTTNEAEQYRLHWEASNLRSEKLQPNSVDYTRREIANIPDDLQQADRFIQFELSGSDFLHKYYTLLLNLQATNNIRTGGQVGAVNEDPLILEEPFVPILDTIRVAYTSSVTIDLPQKEVFRDLEEPPTSALIHVADTGLDHLLHSHPFGFSDLTKNGVWRKIDDGIDGLVKEQVFFPFLPQYPHEGELYLGIQDLKPPQTLSILFQMAEGSSDPRLPSPHLQWSYLDQYNWVPLRGEQVRQDTTDSLQHSGIIQLAIPADISPHHHRMPDGLYWLRLAVSRHTAAVSDTIAIHTQAVKAVWAAESPGLPPPQRVLPPDEITETRIPIPGLETLLQPYSSFGGKMPEQSQAYYLRVSERLRHKNRALTLWDYERLVLEQFPDIYKAKALSADLLDAGAPAGSVTVITIPDIRHRRPFDPFEPRVPQGQIREIQAYLQARAPTFVEVRVQNPRFDYLHFRSPVLFKDRDKNNFAYYADQLQEDIKKYISPWAFDQAAEITFGQDIYLSVLVDFVESRPYVDFLDRPKMFLMERRASDGAMLRIPGIRPIGQGGNIQLRGPDVILVSSPYHSIDYLDDSIPPSERKFSGIGYLKLHLDFEVAPDTPDEVVPQPPITS